MNITTILNCCDIHFTYILFTSNFQKALKSIYTKIEKEIQLGCLIS